MISDHPTVAAASTSSRRPRIEPQAAAFWIEPPRTEQDNSNVINILPVTTLRTIDLEGQKYSDPLLSRFCAELSVFSREILHQNMCITRLPGPPLRTVEAEPIGRG